MKTTWKSIALAASILGLTGCSQPPTSKTTDHVAPGAITSEQVQPLPPPLKPEQITSGMGKAAGSARSATRHYTPGGATYFEKEAGAVSRVDSSQRELGTDYQVAMASPLSTFSADVDTASYANLRRSLLSGQKPAPAGVRVEEMLNYFTYDLPAPKGGQPFSVTSEVSSAPWNPDAQVLRLAIKTTPIDASKRPACNLVFLLDVSGSMGAPDKLPLLKKSLKTLVDNLDDSDHVAIVTYAGSSGLVLPSTPASQSAKILNAIEELQPGGSTHGASGIELAYQVAQESGSEDSVNRVILCTDGDFNVGPASPTALQALIEEKRKSGLFLSVLGFGGSSNDKLMETLADHGNGNYASIDSLSEARKVLVEEAGSTLVTVAKDVKFQVAFNPRLVEKYRLIGYENRRLTTEDFDNDAKDAGDLGAGHSVTALYEIIPPKSTVSTLGDAFEEIGGAKPSADQLAVVKLRYKAPDDDSSELIEVGVPNTVQSLAEASPDQRWAVAVTEFGMHFSNDSHGKLRGLDDIFTLAEGAVGANGDSYRLEFLQLVEAAKKLSS